MNIIAYGSLMNQSSLERTLKRPALLTKTTISGWKRVFNAPFDNYAFLNISREPGMTIEAGSFELNPSELTLFTEREAGSVLAEALPGYFAFVWPDDYCQSLPVLLSYINVCANGAQELGINFTLGLVWPCSVINDTNNPAYRA
jgi:hypothetical protein